MTDWKTPQPSGGLASALLEKLEAENKPKPTALGTPLRYSSFGECARKVAYTVLGAETTPPSGAGLYVMQIGTILHEVIQDAIKWKVDSLWQGATVEFEVASGLGDNLSGSADGVVTVKMEDGTVKKIALEIKTMGGVKFKKQIGFKDRPARIENPAGPALSAIGQAGWNALGSGCDEVVVMSFALENISVGKANEAGMSDADRCTAEWFIPRHVWEPLADRELARQEAILVTLADGQLPDREALDDDGYPELRDVDRHPLCLSYCDYRMQCLSDGAGQPAVPVTLNKKEQ